MNQTWGAALYLENGHLFTGRGFGHQTTQGGEVVFNTGMTGYQEIFTDPSYFKQIVTMGYPHIGNTGINFEDMESERVFLSGIAVREYSELPSSWRSRTSLSEYFDKHKIPAISDVDTREITSTLRDEGAQRGILFPTDGVTDLTTHAKKLLETIEPMDGLELVSRVSCQEPYEFQKVRNESGTLGSIVVLDFGVKTNILRHIRSQHFNVTVVPYNFPFQEIQKLKPAAVVLSNGPGDPATVPHAVGTIQKLVGNYPILAICMGHQLLARALGASTYKLKFGHHGINHPVKDLRTGHILVTSQNHGFAVAESDLKSREISISHMNLNDQTVEGFYSEKARYLSIQFHPEAAPGPSDAGYLFNNFVRGFLQ